MLHLSTYVHKRLRDSRMGSSAVKTAIDLGDIYSCAQNKPIGSHFMKQNADFHESISQA